MVSSAAEPAASFIVISRDQGHYIGECIESIRSQEGGYLIEIVVVDDASADGTLALLDGTLDSRLTVIRHASRAGYAASLAEGLYHARAPFVSCIDGDDRYRPKFLKELLPLFQKNSKVDVIYSDAGIVDESGLMRHARSQTFLPAGPNDFVRDNFLALLEKSFIRAPAMIARRPAWMACLPVPARPALHESYFPLQMARRGLCYYRHRVLADFRVHARDVRSNPRGRGEERAIIRLLDNVYKEREASASRQRAKARVRGRIYAARYLDLASRYFWQRLDQDARRCYRQALRRRPWWIFKRGVARRLLGTLIGRRAYRVLKRWWL